MKKHLGWILLVAVLSIAATVTTTDVLRFRATSLPSSCTTGEMRFDTLTQKIKLCVTNIWDDISGGGSASFVKWIDNFNAEDDASGWAAYKDAASAVPVDGTSGSPTVTITRTTSAGEFWDGEAGFKITKPASDVQGEGVSTDFTIEGGVSDSARVINVEIPYKVSSSNFTYGDLIAFVYNKDATILLGTCSNDQSGKFLQSLTFQKFICSFQTTGGSDDYRLIIHFATTNATAYNVFFEISRFTEDSSVNTEYTVEEDAIYQNWAGDGSTNTTIPYFTNTIKSSLSLLGTVSNSSVSGFSYTALRRHRVTFSFSMRGPGGTNFELGISKNSSQLTTSIGGITAADRVAYTGQSDALGGSNATFTGILEAGDVLRPHTDGGNSGAAAQVHLTILATSKTATVISTNELQKTAVFVRAVKTAQTHNSNGNWTDVTLTSTEDIFGALDGSTGIFTAPKNGTYIVTGSLAFAANATGRRGFRLADTSSNSLSRLAFIETTAALQIDVPMVGSIKMLRGEQFKLQGFQSSGGSLAYATGNETGSIMIYRKEDFTAWTNVSGSYQQIKYDTRAGNGSTNTQIPYFTNTTFSGQSGEPFFTAVNNSTLGNSFTILRRCKISMSFTASHSSSGEEFGISRNASALTSAGQFSGASNAIRLVQGLSTSDIPTTVSVTVQAEPGDVFRAHPNNGASNIGTATDWSVTVLATEI